MVDWKCGKEKHLGEQWTLNTFKSWRKSQNNCLIVQILRYILVIWLEWIVFLSIEGKVVMQRLLYYSLIWIIFCSSLKVITWQHAFAHCNSMPLHTVSLRTKKNSKSLKYLWQGYWVNVHIQAEERSMLMLSFLLLIVTLCGWNQEYTYRISSAKSLLREKCMQVVPTSIY